MHQLLSDISALMSDINTAHNARTVDNDCHPVYEIRIIHSIACLQHIGMNEDRSTALSAIG